MCYTYSYVDQYYTVTLTAMWINIIVCYTYSYVDQYYSVLQY